MKTKKSTLLVILALVATLALSMACLFTACGSKEEVVNCAITWQIPDDVTVKADGYDELPKEVVKDTELALTVTAPTGYTATVKNGSTTVSLKDGKGTAKITKDTTITVTTAKTLNDITVEVLKDVNYFEDNKVDVTTLKVTANYALGDEVLKDTDYTIGYTSGNAFVEGDTSFKVSFGGKTKEVPLTNAVQAAQDFGDATLEVDADGNPVVVVTGRYNAADDKNTAKEVVEGYFTECLERKTWTSKQYKAEATINDDNTFVLRLTILEWTASPTGNHYYFRYAKGGVTADGQNLDCGVSKPTCEPDANNDLPGANYTGEPLEGKDGASLYIGKCMDWGKGCVMVVAVNADAPQFTSVGLEVKDGKPYAVFNGTCGAETTTEALLELIVHLDAEDVLNNNAKPNGEAYIDEKAIVNEDTVSIVIDTEAKTFKVYVLLEGENVKEGAGFFFHLGAQGSDGYYPNVSYKGDENANTITVGGLKFTFVTATDLGLTESWQASLLYISVSAV